MVLKSGMAGLMIYLKAEFSCYKSVKPKVISFQNSHGKIYMGETFPFQKQKSEDDGKPQ